MAWPDWRGARAVIVATGPSAKDASLHRLKGPARPRIIAIKSAWGLVSRADVIYGSDRGWWEDNEGVPWFGGLKLTASPFAAAMFDDLHAIRVTKSEAILRSEIGTVGCGSRRGGGHSGFHALNLAVQFGANPIVLVGFDMSNGHPDTKVHKAAMERAVEQLAGLGITVTFGL